MYNVRNKKESAKMYSVIGKASVGGDDVLVQNGMFGAIGEQIEDNIYEFVPVSATSKKIFVMATPEIDADESKVEYNSLHGFKMKLGQVGDVTEVELYSKGEISEDMVTVSGTIEKKGYLQLKADARKLEYSATKPESGALLIAKIEDIVPATQGMFIGVNGKNLALSYKNIRFRVIETL